MEECVIKQLEEQLGYFEAVVQYLDVSGNLTLLKAQCEKYAKTKSLVYTFKLLIDPSDICESNAILGNLLLQEPVTATDIFKQVSYKTIQVLELLPGARTLSQVAVILRLSTLPVFPKLNLIENIRCLSRVHDARIFCCLTGVVTGLSAVSKYTLSARYYCTDEDCQGHYGNHFIRIHTPGASEAQTVRKDFKCSFCSLTLSEEKSSRTLSGVQMVVNNKGEVNVDMLLIKGGFFSITIMEKVLAEVIPEKTMSDIHSHNSKRSRGQAIPVYIRDDLTKVVEIGETYEIIGTSRKDVLDDRIMLTIEANNIKKVKTEISASKLLKELHRNILTLYKDRKSSPWSFVLTLAYLFGGDISPPGCHFCLKLALLLSLVSKRDTKTKPLHILAVGTETEVISRLLQFGTRFKLSSTSVTAGQSLTGHVTLDRYNSASYFVEGGLLHLSQGGVCNVADIGRLKKSTKHSLQSALSGGKIVTDVAPKYTGSLPHHIEQKLKSRIWGYSDPSSSRKQAPKDTEVFVGACTGDVPKTLLDTFSLVCFTDHGDITSNEMVEGQMIETTLMAALEYDDTDTSSGTQLPVSTEDFQQFIRFASQLRPKFRKEAETLIHSYYMTSRKTRSTSDGTDVPVNADQTLLSLAYSHAKLALRNEVTLNDALMAVKIYEEYLTNRFGYSTLNVQPIPHITSNLLNFCIGPMNDKQMQDFHRNLLRYCSLASGLEE